MGVLSDRQIEKLAGQGMIRPYRPMQKRPGVISYGVSSMGYDVRIGYKFRVFKSYPHTEIDPKNFNPALLEKVDLTPCEECNGTGETENADGGPRECGCDVPKYILIPPHSFALGESIETFDIPRDILVVALGKSTYARCGLVVNVTPGEPGWKGEWTIEMSNTTPLPMRVYAGEGIMQCLFLRSDERDRATEVAMFDALWGQHTKVEEYQRTLLNAGCGISYRDKKGKYQEQQGLTLPKVD